MCQEHCYTCGSSHDKEKSCPHEAFNVMQCGACNNNESIIPLDACFAMYDITCGQCGIIGNWVLRRATVEDMQKYWKGEYKT